MDGLSAECHRRPVPATPHQLKIKIEASADLEDLVVLLSGESFFPFLKRPLNRVPETKSCPTCGGPGETSCQRGDGDG